MSHFIALLFVRVFFCIFLIIFTLNFYRPCILLFDSLVGANRNRVVATLRDYLTCEYRVKIRESTNHTFNKTNIPGNSVKVPQQTNFTDCGLYVLQYVEQFFKVKETNQLKFLI